MAMESARETGAGELGGKEKMRGIIGRRIGQRRDQASDDLYRLNMATMFL